MTKVFVEHGHLLLEKLDAIADKPEAYVDLVRSL